jgi:hypothetical protein
VEVSHQPLIPLCDLSGVSAPSADKAAFFTGILLLKRSVKYFTRINKHRINPLSGICCTDKHWRSCAYAPDAHPHPTSQFQRFVTL